MKVIFVVVIFAIFGVIVSTSWEDCTGLDIGTTPSGYDIVSNGKVQDEWKTEQNYTYLAGQDDKFEFMYIRNNLNNPTSRKREDLMHASTSILCSKRISQQPILRKNSEEMYELEFDYRCANEFIGLIDFVFTIETLDKRCKVSFHWKKECKLYHRPMFAQNVDWENHDTFEHIHSIYKNGKVRTQVYEKDPNQFDKMSIDNAIPIDIGKTVRISYYTQNTNDVRQLFEQNQSQYKLPISEIYNKMSEFAIERPNIIYDQEVQETKIEGNLNSDLKVGLTKRYINISTKCLYYIPEESTTISVVLSIPGFDDYAIYFYGWCNTDMTQPHVAKYNNPMKAFVRDNNQPLLVFPKMEFKDQGIITQLSEDRFTGIVSSESQQKGAGMLDFEQDPLVLSEIKKSAGSISMSNSYYKNKSAFFKLFMSNFSLMKTLFLLILLLIGALIAYYYYAGAQGYNYLARMYKSVFKMNPSHSKCDQDIEDVIEKECETDVSTVGDHSMQILDSEKKNYRDQ